MEKSTFFLENSFNYNSLDIWYDNSIFSAMVDKYEQPECIFKCYCSKFVYCPEFNKQTSISIKIGEKLSGEKTTKLESKILYINIPLILKAKWY